MPFFVINRGCLLYRCEAADSCSNEHSDPVGVGFIDFKSRVLERLQSGHQPQLDKTVHLACFFSSQATGRIESGGLAGYGRGQSTGVKMAYCGNAAATCCQARPGFAEIEAQR